MVLQGSRNAALDIRGILDPDAADCGGLNDERPTPPMWPASGRKCA